MLCMTSIFLHESSSDPWLPNKLPGIGLRFLLVRIYIFRSGYRYVYIHYAGNLLVGKISSIHHHHWLRDGSQIPTCATRDGPAPGSDGSSDISRRRKSRLTEVERRKEIGTQAS